MQESRIRSPSWLGFNCRKMSVGRVTKAMKASEVPERRRGSESPGKGERYTVSNSHLIGNGSPQ